MRRVTILICWIVMVSLAAGCGEATDTDEVQTTVDASSEDTYTPTVQVIGQQWPLPCDVPGKTICQPTGRVRDMTSVGGTLYVSDDEYGILIYDVSQPGAAVIELSEMPD